MAQSSGYGMDADWCGCELVGAHQGTRLPSGPGRAGGAPPRPPGHCGRLRRRGAGRVQRRAAVRVHLTARGCAQPRGAGLEGGGARQAEHHEGPFIPLFLSLQCEG